MSGKQVINYTHTTPSVQHIIVMLTEIFDTSMQFHVALIDREIIMCVCMCGKSANYRRFIRTMFEFESLSLHRFSFFLFASDLDFQGGERGKENKSERQ